VLLRAITPLSFEYIKSKTNHKIVEIKIKFQIFWIYIYKLKLKFTNFTKSKTLVKKFLNNNFTFKKKMKVCKLKFDGRQQFKERVEIKLSPNMYTKWNIWAFYKTLFFIVYIITFKILHTLLKCIWIESEVVNIRRALIQININNFIFCHVPTFIRRRKRITCSAGITPQLNKIKCCPCSYLRVHTLVNVKCFLEIEFNLFLKSCLRVKIYRLLIQMV